jgi:hypothetical protein
MNVNYRAETTQKAISALTMGDIFKYKGEFYMVTLETDVDEVKCVELTSDDAGYICSFHFTTFVTPYPDVELLV